MNNKEIINVRVRKLEEVPVNELIEATVDMMTKLGVPGSTNVYNIYSAVQAEYKKAVDFADMMSDNI